jgi:hypothetical protein
MPGIPSPDDPLWLKAQEIVNRMPAIRMSFFLGRLNETLLFAKDMLNLYRDHGKSTSIARGMSGLPGLLELLPFNEDVTPEEQQRARDEIAQKYEEETKRKADQPEGWILNQALVTLCTAFDTFLEELVEVVLQTKVEILYGVAGAKNIELKEAVRLGSLEAIVANLREKEVERFTFERIKQRLEYLDRRLGLQIKETFSR